MSEWINPPVLQPVHAHALAAHLVARKVIVVTVPRVRFRVRFRVRVRFKFRVRVRVRIRVRVRVRVSCTHGYCCYCACIAMWSRINIYYIWKGKLRARTGRFSATLSPAVVITPTTSGRPPPMPPMVLST